MVRTIVFGGGKQGTRAAEKLTESLWMPDSDNLEGGLSGRFDIEETVIVEGNEARARDLENRFSENDLVEVVNQDAEEYIEQEELSGLIFDATDTDVRLNSVTETLSENLEEPVEVAYWSEKPAADEIADIESAGAVASMDLIENFSLQKQSVIEDIESEGYEIDSISTWRTSKTDKQVQYEEEGDEREIDWEQSRNLFAENAGSTKDKGAHDWGNILLTLEAAGQDLEIEIDEENSEYQVIHVNKDGRIFAYTESGEEVEIPYSGDERLNDGYANIRGSSGNIDLRVVTALADWPRQIEEEMDELYEEFREGLEQELGEVNLVYGEKDNEEIRVEHLEAHDPETGEEVEYLVSTGEDMFTLKKTETTGGETNYELLAEGGIDFLACYLQEGLEALQEDHYEQTVTVDSAVKTGEILERVAKAGYQNRGDPIEVDAHEGTDLREVLEN